MTLATMTNNAPDDTALALPNEPLPIDDFHILTTLGDGGLVPIVDRIDAHATISAGYKGEDGYPNVSRDGTIYLHDPDHRAPALRKALAAADQARRGADNKVRIVDGHPEPMVLTIAFPFNDPNLFIQQSVRRYSASALQVYGDQNGLHEIVTREKSRDRNGRPILELAENKYHERGTQRFKELLKTCKGYWSIFFALAYWEGEGVDAVARMPFDDGYPGLYRLRTTSSESVENIVNTLRHAARSRALGGRFAGLPFDLRITYPERADPTGTKRNAPVWSITAKPPAGITLSGANLRQIVGRAIAEAEALQPGAGARALPAPSPETWQAALVESVQAIDDETADADEIVETLTSGDPPVDPKRWEARFFVRFRGTVLAEDEARAGFLEEFTHDWAHPTDSLAVFLEHARASDCARLFAEADRFVAFVATEQRKVGDRQRPRLTYDDVLAVDDDGQPRSSAAVLSPAAAEPQAPAGAPPPAGASRPDTLETECANCGTVQMCRDDSEAYVCVDRQACEARVMAEFDAVDPALETHDADDVRRDETREQLEVEKWLSGLRERMESHPESTVPAARDTCSTVGKLLTEAVADVEDVAQRVEAARRLMHELTGVSGLRELSHGACVLLIEEAATPGWARMVAALRESRGF